MKTERTMKLDRKEIVSLIERKYGTKFWKTCLSSTGFKGWEDNQDGNENN